MPQGNPRRILRKGQLSYAGSTYGLGASYADTQCWVEAAGDRLLVHCPGRATVTLHKRS